MALCVKRNDEEFYSRNDLKILDLANLIACMSNLSTWGFLYSEETVYYGHGKPLWDVCLATTPEEGTDNLSNIYWLTDRWQEMYEQFPVTSIRMTFRHFLTGQEKYLYVKSETPPQGHCTLVWISEEAYDDCNIYHKGRFIRDMPPMFEKLLVANQLILSEGTFKELDLLYIWPEETAPDYHFTSVLYQQGYRPLREGYGKPKVDRHDEQSMAWAGEYINIYDSGSSPTYYYFFFAKRDYEEWECDYYNGEPRCIWDEPKRSFYIARSHTPINRVFAHGEPAIILEKIPGIEQIRAYLDNCSKLDKAVNLRFDDADYWM